MSHTVKKIPDLIYKGRNRDVPPGPPFDGEPVLIRLASGWVEAWWCDEDKGQETSLGPAEVEGFCWVCLDDKFEAELEEAIEWASLPPGCSARGDKESGGGMT